MAERMEKILGQRPSSWPVLVLFLGVLFLWTTTARAEDIQIDQSAAPATAAPAVPSAPAPAAQAPAATPVPATPTPVPAKHRRHHKPKPPENDETDHTLSPLDRLAKSITGKTVLVLTGDAELAHVYQGDAKDYTDNGGGIDLRVELEFPFWISLGLDYDVTYLINHQTFIGPLDMFGRILPWQTSQDGKISPYLIGGLGINSLVNPNPEVGYPGNFHGFAGVGARINLNDHWGIDLNAVYNYYSPQLAPMSSFSARGGLSYAWEL